MKRQFSRLCAGLMLTLLAGSATAAPPPDDYAAPFGVVGTASATNPPPFSTGTPPPDVTNEVVITPSGPAPAPPSPPATPPSNPPPIDTGAETYKKTYELCVQMIPAVRDGFYDYINNDPNNITGTAVYFVVPGSTGVDAAILKRCLENGYRPPESALHTCASCQGIVTNIYDGFYWNNPPLVGYDWSSGDPIYDFTSIMPKWVRSCLLIGHWPNENSMGPGWIRTCADPYYWYDPPLAAQTPPNYCPPTDGITWTVAGKTCSGGVGSAAVGTNSMALSNTPNLDGFAYVTCNGTNWVMDGTKTALNTCGEAKPKDDDCKPGSYTVSYNQTLKNGTTVTNYCKAGFPTGRDTELIPMNFPHTYWPPAVDAWSAGSGDFVCDKNQTGNGLGGWVPQANFKCERPDP